MYLHRASRLGTALLPNPVPRTSKVNILTYPTLGSLTLFTKFRDFPSLEMSSTQPSWLGKVGRAVFKLVRTLLPLHAASWKASSDPIKRLLNIDDVTEKDRLTTLWKDNSLSQLNFIGVTVSLSFNGI